MAADHRGPGGQWAKLLRWAHGMFPEQWQAMFAEQSGLCYLCEQPLPASRSKVYIDHDRSCCPPMANGGSKSCGFCRRGLTCQTCNTGIGMFSDDPAKMRRVADNLERAQALLRALQITKPDQPELCEEDSA